MATTDLIPKAEQGIFDPKAAASLIKAIKEDLPGTIKVFEDLAAKGPERTALAVGGALLVIPIADKWTFVVDHTTVRFATPEFMALVAAGVLLILLGAVVTAYNYKLSIEAGARFNEHLYQMSAQQNLYLLQLEAWTHQRILEQAAKPAGPSSVTPPSPPYTNPVR